MSFIRGIIQREPAASLTILSWAAGAAMALAGHPELTPVLVAAGAAFLGLRTQVVPKGKAEETAIQAATDAATTVASNLTATTVGTFGQITGEGAQVVDAAVGLVKDLVGGKK